MKCRDCKFCYSNETMGELYICVNGHSEMLGEFTGIMCEDDCPDGEADFPEDPDTSDNECKSCEYCDMTKNTCYIDDKKCYENGKCLNNNCFSFTKGHWEPQQIKSRSFLEGTITKTLSGIILVIWLTVFTYAMCRI